MNEKGKECRVGLGGVGGGAVLAASNQKRVRRKHEANPREAGVASEGGIFVGFAHTDVTGTIGGSLGTQ